MNDVTEDNNEEVNAAPVAEAVSEAPVASGQKGIKETLEMIQGLKHLAGFGGKVLADGSVSLDDLKHLATLATNMGALVAAVDDASDIYAELKDLDQAETIQIIMGLYGVAKEFSATKHARVLTVY